jgi:tetratricopeptide (TPR) repeat protein
MNNNAAFDDLLLRNFDAVFNSLPSSDDTTRTMLYAHYATLRLGLFQRWGRTEDLDEAIEKMKRGVEIMPNNNPDLAGLPGTLGDALLSRFGRIGKMGDLEEGIQLSRQAIESTQRDNPGIIGRLNNLGNALNSRYEHTGKIKDLEEAIERTRQAINIAPKNHPDLAGWLNNLGLKLGQLYKRSGQTKDLEEAIQVNRQAIECAPKDYPYLATMLSNLGGKLKRLHERTGQVHLLKEAIQVSQQAVELTPSGSPGLAGILINLGNALESIHECTGKIEDLEEAFQLKQRAVELIPKDHLDRARALCSLGNVLESRYKYTGNMKDLEEAIARTRQAINITPKDHPDLAGWLNDLGGKFKSRYERLGQIEDLEEAIHVVQQGVKITPEDHLDLATWQSNLGNALASRYERIGEIEDLEEAIQLTRRALKLKPRDHPNRAGLLSDLGSELKSRYERIGKIEDLEEAIQVVELAVKLTPDDRPNYAVFKQGRESLLAELTDMVRTDNVKGTSFTSRPILLEELSETIISHGEPTGTGAIESTEDALDESSTSGTEFTVTIRSFDLQRSLQWALDNDGKEEMDFENDSNKLDKAIYNTTQELQASSEDHPDRHMWFNNLAANLYSRFKLIGSLDDLNAAIKNAELAVDGTPNDNLSRASRLNSLQDMLYRRYEETGQIGHLDEAIRRAEEADQLIPGSHLKRVARLKSLRTELESRLDAPQKLVEKGSVVNIQQSVSQIEKKETATPNQLCSLCLSLFEEEVDWDEQYHLTWYRHRHENDLEPSASSGCHMCSLILYSLQRRRDAITFHELSDQRPKADFGRYIGVGIRFEKGRGGMVIIAPNSGSKLFMNTESFVHFSYLSRVSQGLPGSPHNESIPFRNDSKSTVLQIRNWLEQCQDIHHLCNDSDTHKIKDSGEYPLPTRLLEVKDCSGALSVRLINSETLSPETKYMTLSYRWPKEPTIILTKENKASFQQKITATDLPKAIQDAIWLANELDCHYLWVDALCILQDSGTDWLQESAKMCDYYMRSLLSISASNADSASGFLKIRNPLSIMPCRIIPKRKARPLHIYPPSELMNNEVDPLKRLPLYQRGWVFQERLLAPRIVHFTDIEVFWECAATLSSDFQLEYVIKDLDRKRWLAYNGAELNNSHLFFGDTLTDPGTLGYFLSRGNPFGPIEVVMWTELIEEYSGLSLTKEVDKLVAIGGLAKRSSQVASGKLGRYFAGLWEECFALQLDWTLDWKTVAFTASLVNPRSTTTYKAPSWSWASVNCRITYSRSFKISDKKWFTLHDVHIEHKLDEYGPVKSGWLRVRGSLHRMRITRSSEKNSELYPKMHMHFGKTRVPDEDYEVCLDGNPRSEIPHPEGITVYAFPIASYGQEPSYSSLSTLLLRPTGKKRGQYTRVGVLHLGMTEKRDQFISNYQHQPRLESHLYQDYQDNSEISASVKLQYTIEII